MASGPGTPFAAACQAHPGLLDVADAKKVCVPTCVLASGEEDAEEVRAWGEAVGVEKRVEVWGGMVHGWMSARGDLEDGVVRAEFERGYAVFGEWFGRWL